MDISKNGYAILGGAALLLVAFGTAVLFGTTYPAAPEATPPAPAVATAPAATPAASPEEIFGLEPESAPSPRPGIEIPRAEALPAPASDRPAKDKITVPGATRHEGSGHTEQKVSITAEDLGLIQRVTRGNAGFSAPKTAVVGSTFRAMLRVDTKELDSILKSLAAALPKNDALLGERDIKLTPRMSATLSGIGFNITPEHHSPVQPITMAEPTTWAWQVEATKAGTLHLSVTLSQTLLVEGREYPRNYPPFSRIVQVEAKPFSASDFFSAHWQWLGTIVIVPLAKVGWDRFSKPKDTDRGHSGARTLRARLQRRRYK
jgi:hypothetical protein